VPPQGGRRWLERIAAKAPALLGGAPPEAELAAIAGRLAHPGPYLGLVHGDPCPDNVLLTPAGARLIDFEFATPGHVLFDAAYWRLGFPTCWCAGRVPDAVADRVEQAYRYTIGEAVAEAASDEDFRREHAVISFAWLFSCLDWQLEDALREDETWGIATRRSRILWYLEAAIGAANAAGILPGLHDAAASWLKDLRARWPQSSMLAPYPAFAAETARQRPGGIP
jgi:hypothetical protein